VASNSAALSLRKPSRSRSIKMSALCVDLSAVHVTSGSVHLRDRASCLAMRASLASLSCGCSLPRPMRVYKALARRVTAKSGCFGLGVLTNQADAMLIS
jgi:hypothetical protein